MRASVALALTVSAALGGCGDFEPARGVFARRYDPERGCLEAIAIVDVVDGAAASPCEGRRCWRAPSGEVFVTDSNCDVPDDYVDQSVTVTGSNCARALEAAAREDGSCE